MKIASPCSLWTNEDLCSLVMINWHTSLSRYQISLLQFHFFVLLGNSCACLHWTFRSLPNSHDAHFGTAQFAAAFGLATFNHPTWIIHCIWWTMTCPSRKRQQSSSSWAFDRFTLADSVIHSALMSEVTCCSCVFGRVKIKVGKFFRGWYRVVCCNIGEACCHPGLSFRINCEWSASLLVCERA